MFPKFGPLELILILVIVTMLFGVGKLPEIFGAVGRGVKEFRKNAEVGDETDESSKPAADTDSTPTSPTTPTSPA
jgi:sec-independent protein translocase protein TatA